MYAILGGVSLGWALGANNAANVFGTAVASRIVRYRTAIILCAVFVVVGALVEGGRGIRTLGQLTHQNELSALVTCLVAALTVTVMTALKLPVSTSQAIAGCAIGMGLYVSPGQIGWIELGKMMLCWVGTPIGAAIMAFLLYPILAWMLERLRLNVVTRSIVLKIALIISGSYGAYALGANNVGNVTGVFYNTGLFGNNETILCLIGGLSIALGILTYSRNVMFTVGYRLVELDAFCALVAVLAMAGTVHVYAKLGVPVSTSQAIVGSVLGIGLLKGIKTVSRRTLVGILFGWIATPLLGGMACYCLAVILLSLGLNLS